MFTSIGQGAICNSQLDRAPYVTLNCYTWALLRTSHFLKGQKPKVGENVPRVFNKISHKPNFWFTIASTGSNQ